MLSGSCTPGPAEYAARNAADIAWMQQTFDEAKGHHSAAVMFISQRDPGFDATDATWGPVRDPKTLVETDSLPATDPAAPSPTPDGFHDFPVALRLQVIAFERPVAYVHGDSTTSAWTSRFWMRKGDDWRTSPASKHFKHLATIRSRPIQPATTTIVDARSRDVFSYQAQIVPANRVAVPAP